MSVFFNYDNPICNEGNSPSVFSFDPSILSLKELLLCELKHLAYYIVKLSDLEIDTRQIRDKIIQYISLVFVNLDFKRDEFKEIIEEIKHDRMELEKSYYGVCKQRGSTFQPLKPSYDLKSGSFDIISAINEGEKQAILKNTILSENKKTLYEVMMSIIKNACLHLVEIENYGEDCSDSKDAVITLLNTTNFPTTPDEKWLAKINDFNKVSLKIMAQLRNIFSNNYGGIEEHEVNLDLKEGPAILVSGHFIKDLEEVLKATQNEDIKVYTHNEMLIAHSLKGIQSYPNLTGHFRRGANNIQMDFASFPGAILISKNSQPNIEIIRGRIFTSDQHTSFGMSKIENNDFGPLIQAAKESRGFKEDKPIGSLKVGYNKEKVLEKINEIISKIKDGSIKHLFIIDLISQFPTKDNYIESLIENIPDDCFTISLSFNKEKSNVWHLDSFYGYSLAYMIFDKLIENLNEDELKKVSVFLTQCNMQTISHILNIKTLGINSIYLGNCCPTAVNPSLIKGLNDIFNVKYMKGNPKDDLHKILKQNGYES